MTQCRLCAADLDRVMIDLGVQPLANSYLTEQQLANPEPGYPLVVRVCDRCLLAQLDHCVPPEEIFTDYAYFSSYSTSWDRHARDFARRAVKELQLSAGSLVIELASNDGYLLRHFRGLGVEVLGVDPAANVARAAEDNGIPTVVEFFGRRCAARLATRRRAELLVANNVLAHVPDLDDFVAGMAMLLAPGGRVSIEVPHLLRLLEGGEFDTIYHEHFSYFSLLSARRALEAHGLAVIDVEELPTHGGSLRIWAMHTEDAPSPGSGVKAVLEQEQAAGLESPHTYTALQEIAGRCRSSLLDFLKQARSRDERVVAYGAAAKGNTLLNYCQVGPTDIDFVVDKNVHKQGRYLPGSHLPILSPETVTQARPDFLLILPWNLKDEVMEQMSALRQWGGRFVTAVPEVQVYP